MVNKEGKKGGEGDAVIKKLKKILDEYSEESIKEYIDYITVCGCDV